MPNNTVPAAATGLPFEIEYRALDVLDRIPAMHEGVVVRGHDFDPHLKRGEIAVVDTQDKSLQFGELYVITLSEGTAHASLAIVQLLREVPTVSGTGLYYGFSLKGNGDTFFEGKRLTYVDGPLRTDYWSTKCVGRVVGVMQPRWEGRS